MKIAGVVILYYPDESIKNYIYTYLYELSKLYIIDNSEFEHSSLLNDINTENVKIQYLHTGENNGIAESLNTVCRLALKEGYLWLLTMDQDSNFNSGEVRKYFTQIQNFTELASVAMFGVSFFNSQTNDEIDEYKDISAIITSGSVVNLTNFEIVGGFDKKLFIDEVDVEFCFRAINKGLRIILCTTISLNHKLGILNYSRSIKNFKNTSRILHAPVRIYYMVRNHLYMYSKYKTEFGTELQISRKLLVNRLKNNLLYNSKRLKVIKFLIKGFIDFKMNKMGKLH